MKKILAIILCASMIFCFAACGEETNTDKSDNSDKNSSLVENTSSEPKVAVMPDEPLTDWMRGKNAEFRIRICTFADKFTMVNTTYDNTYYQPQNQNETYVYFLIEIKNLSSEYVFGLDEWRETPVNYYVNGDSKANFMWIYVEELDGEVKGNAILNQNETAYAHYFAPIEKTKISEGVVVKGKIDGIEFEQKVTK